MQDVSPVYNVGRILYVEPNDVFGKINGEPMTPDYADYCIGFNLVCEVVSRYKRNTSMGTDSTKKYEISWTSSLSEEKATQAPSWISFLRGTKQGRTNIDGLDEAAQRFLSTYYTDITFDEVVEKTVVEGLGVENVTVAFENYYTPTVTIKFVDHRGAALIGREEATHYDDKLTIDNIFGAFFTAPYPKFKLQIKGFYGKPITLQLTCSGFKANLNPQTGNFEATATFIGYSYSLLTDIPFRYIVAAPYCEYKGKDYWDGKVAEIESADHDWALSDGNGGYTKMVKLQDFYDNLNKAFKNEKLLDILSAEQQKGVEDITESTKNIDDAIKIINYEIKKAFEADEGINVKDTYRNFDNDGNLVKQNIDTIDDEEILFIFDDTVSEGEKKEIKLGKGIIEKFNTLNETLSKLGMEYEISPVITASEGMTFALPKFEGNDKKEYKLDGDIKIARSVYNYMDEYFQGHKENGVYFFVIHLNDLLKKLHTQKSANDKLYSDIINETERNYVKLAKDHLQVVPYIGNLFKMVIAHIETLVAMMFSCFENIQIAAQNGGRSASILGIKNLDWTDFVIDKGNNKDAIVPAWPQVVGSEKIKKSEDPLDTLAWVGDFSHNFEEEKLVRALFFACKRVAEGKPSAEDVPIDINYVPIIPIDVNDKSDVNKVFRVPVTGNVLLELAGSLGIRMAQIFGVTLANKNATELASVIGEMDALNYFLSNSDKTAIKEKIFGGNINKTENSGSGETNTPTINDELSNTLLYIMECNEEALNKYGVKETSNNSHFPFEVLPKDGRQAIFEKGDTNLKYTYLTSNNIPIVPSAIKSFDTYKEFANNKIEMSKVVNGNDISVIDIKSMIHLCDDTTLFKNWCDNNDQFNKYVNNEMFNVITESRMVSGIYKKYEELKTGSLKVSGEVQDIGDKRVKNVLDALWHLDDIIYEKYVNGLQLGLSDEAMGLTIENTTETANNNPAQVNNWDILTNNANFPKYKNGGWSIDKPASKPKEEKKSDSNKDDDKKEKEKNKNSISQEGLYLKTFEYEYKSDNRTQYYYSEDDDNVKAEWVLNYLYRNNNTPKTPNGQKSSSTIGFIENDGNSGIYVTTYGKLLHYAIHHSNNKQPHIKNVLEKLFENFVKGDFQTIKEGIELYGTDESGNKFSTDLAKYNDIKKDLNNLLTQLSTNNENGQPILTDAKEEFKKGIYQFSTKFRTMRLNSNGNNDTNNTNNNNTIQVHLNETNTEFQKAVRKLLLKKVIIVKTNRVTNNNAITISGDTANAYLGGFTKRLKTIVESSNQTTNTEEEKAKVKTSEETPHEDEKEFTRDLAIPIYMYLKMLWDKWLISSKPVNYTENKPVYSSDDEYSVRQFYNNFVFTDSFYRNITHRFMINCQVFMNTWNGNTMSNDDVTVFKFLGDITTNHHCLFLSVPDFISDLGSGESAKAKTALESIFTPIPYESIPSIQNNNKFVIIYIPKLSETPSEMNNFRYDGFNIWSYNDSMIGNPNINAINGSFKAPNGLQPDPNIPRALQGWGEETEATRDTDPTQYGYFVPSFGLAYGRMNNHLFKNVNLNMDTPVMTSAVINTMTHIATQGANVHHRIAYVGQDLYPVFSNYSYTCEFEMMGCAQIQPLMYFQLMNVPMWRGTYMIFNVTHTMTPGNMVTKVRAMKLSNRGCPYSNQWFTKNLNYQPEGTGSADCNNSEGSPAVTLDTGSGNNYQVAVKPGMFTGKSDEEKKKMVKFDGYNYQKNLESGIITVLKLPCRTHRGDGKIMCNKYIKDDILAIVNDIKTQAPWYDLYITSDFRPTGATYSKHKAGLALDIHSYENPWFDNGVPKDFPEPAEGTPQPWRTTKHSQRSGLKYDRTKCIWHWGHPVVKIFEAHGWHWGGAFGDTMHFSLLKNH